MKQRVGDIDVGYDRAGAGDPVLLVMGLATTRIGWTQQMPVLAERYDVACFDNRGIGETDVPSESWTMEQMADDAVGLMDAFGWQRAHVVGISMGGMISQELTLRHPQRVRSLTLLATQHGGPDAVHPADDVLAMFGEADPELRLKNGLLVTFGKTFQREHPEFVELALNFVRQNPPSLHGVLNQMLAIMHWSAAGGSAGRLGQIGVPTLVMHGDEDELIPVANGRSLAAKIPGAKLVILEQTGHAVNAERVQAVNAAILEHLAAS